ncbi:HvfC/BufC family peptide modification chaperone [Lysobacter xanthus]
MTPDALDLCAAAVLSDPVAPVGVFAATGVSSTRRWSIHRNTAAFSLCEALAASFPVARALVGDAFFDSMALDFIRVHPPRSPVLVEYGDAFPDFVAVLASESGVPYLPDVMRLERLCTRAAHAADPVAVPPSTFAALVADPERLAATAVRLQPACGWLRSDHPVGALWRAHLTDGPVDAEELATIDLDRAEDVLVVRDGFAVRVITLPACGIDWLDALQAGMPIGAALVLARSRHPNVDVHALFSLLIQHGLVAELRHALETF